MIDCIINSTYNVKIYDFEGHLIKQIGLTTASTAPGEFTFIRYGIFATEDFIYVCDSTNDNVQIFK